MYHKCFGNGYGLCLPNLFIDRTSRCIECLDCFGMFSFEHFVSHAHKYLENSTVHWGFDSANWRYYLKVANDQNNRDHKFNKILDLIYENYENASASDRSSFSTKIHQELLLSSKRRLAVSHFVIIIFLNNYVRIVTKMGWVWWGGVGVGQKFTMFENRVKPWSNFNILKK